MTGLPTRSPHRQRPHRAGRPRDRAAGSRSRDGRIAESARARRRSAAWIMGGDLLMPGLVELHTDHLEAHFAPRPNVHWDPVAAVVVL